MPTLLGHLVKSVYNSGSTVNLKTYTTLTLTIPTRLGVLVKSVFMSGSTDEARTHTALTATAHWWGTSKQWTSGPFYIISAYK